MQLSLHCDQPELAAGRADRRHLVVRLTAPTAPTDAERPPLPPLDLGLVVDTSGSMSGARLASAKLAAAGVVEALSPEDRLTLVSFGTDVGIHLDQHPATSEGVRAAVAAIRRLSTSGMTNLSGGWLAGGGLLAEGGPWRRRHLVVLSDGRANQGEVLPQPLIERGRELLARGVTTTAVGIGHDYATRQLAALAEGGGGRLHDASRPEEIVEVLLGELREVSDVTAENARLVLHLPAGAVAEELSGLPTSTEFGALVCPLGGLRSGVSRRLALRLDLPPLEPGAVELTAELHWTDPASGDSHSAQAVARFEVVAHEPGPATRGVVEDVLLAWEAGLVRKLTQRSEERDERGLRELLRTDLPHFECFALEHLDDLHRSRDLRRLLERALRHRLSRAVCKQIGTHVVKGAKGERDLRAARQGTLWTDYLD